MKYILHFFCIFSFAIASLPAFSQADRGGSPRSFLLLNSDRLPLLPIDIEPVDMALISKEDIEDARLEKSYRVGVEIPVVLSSSNNGQWDDLPQGGRLWRVAVKCKGALGLGLNFNSMSLPRGADLFVYTPDHRFVIGAMTSAEIPVDNKFATRPLPGEELIIEYYEPITVHQHLLINITGLSYIYRGFDVPTNTNYKSDLSVNCEVNVNCEEGADWQKQKQGVVKILTKVGSKYFFCSGTLLNNTVQDFSALLLTASHCSSDFGGGIATADDFSRWLFYFNYESPGCSSTSVPELTLTGAQKLATSDNPSDMGSDFLLLKFLGDIPPKYHPFYCGWDAGYGNSSYGVCIHHPNGEIKKISTYNTMLGSGTWGSTPNTHWMVKWAATSNGFGVTEGGSSGSPLFDEEGLVIGTLTGGPSSCESPDGEDLFGKISYSWISNGTEPTQQLKPWLDPANTGILKMPGTFNENLAVADFSSTGNVIPVGGTIDFQDLSSGKPDTWHWYFQGGDPAESSVRNPSGIRFERYGEMNVKLVVSNTYNSDSIVKEKFIDVRAVVSPNPCNGVVNILTDINNQDDLVIEVFDMAGKIAQRFAYSGASSESYSIKLPEYGNVFTIRVIHGNQIQSHKVVVVH